MKSGDIPSELSITMDGACELSLECWRLRRLAEQARDSNIGPGLRYAVRRMTGTLEKLGIEVLDFAGWTYDPGMVPDVVEVREDAALQAGQAIIDETIAPTVMWHKHVVRPGQIIVRRPIENPQVSEVTE
jgi:hypothetical protein